MSAFDSIDFESTEGARIKVMLEARLQELRVKNDDVGLGERETAFTRGCISETKKWLAGAKPIVPLQSYNQAKRGTQ
jgi:hypothetical protein